MPSSRREQLVETAVNLFYRHGYHATGIDKILAEAHVSKPTLYKHFRSKDELIIAALRRWDEQSRNWLMREMERRGRTPQEQLLALYDTLEDWFGTPGFQGCMFVNAAAEFAEQNNPIHVVAAEHKRLFGAYIQELAARTGAANPGELAKQLLLLMEGAIVTTHVSGKGDAARRAKRIAQGLMEQALSEVA